ncbi:MAG: type II secretion system protein [Verrucomicrobiota bacterium]
MQTRAQFQFQLRKFGGRRLRRVAAFTVIELLVVIGIIGILSYAAMPALKNIKKADSVKAASQQLIDDIAFARREAIRNRSTVYMVFLPNTGRITTAGLDPRYNLYRLTNILTKQYTGYALYTDRRLGDQPGQGSPKYLTEWKPLPQGVFIASNKFSTNYVVASATARATNVFQFRTYSIPFPYETNTTAKLPAIAFNYLGQLASLSTEVIPLARGYVTVKPWPASAVPGEDPAGNSSDPLKFNHVVIDGLTGRAWVDRMEVWKLP